MDITCMKRINTIGIQCMKNNYMGVTGINNSGRYIKDFSTCTSCISILTCTTKSMDFCKNKRTDFCVKTINRFLCKENRFYSE